MEFVTSNVIFETSNSTSLEQLRKAKLPIDCKDSGKAIEVRALQLLKAFSPIDCTESGKVIEISLEQ